MEIKQMFGVIFMVSSLARMMYIYRYGFSLKYRAWVKGVIGAFWGALFAVGTCFLMGL